MTKKKKTIIAIIILLVLILLLLAFWWLWPKKTVSVKNTASNQQINTEVGIRSNSENQNPSSTSQPKTVVNSDLESLAQAFAERYGSFSSESDLANLKDLLDFMSTSLRASTENYIATIQSSNEYYGVTTRVLSVKIKSLEETNGFAEVEISTQREESKGSPQNSEVKYQILVLQYVKENGIWKVNSAIWQ